MRAQKLILGLVAGLCPAAILATSGSFVSSGGVSQASTYTEMGGSYVTVPGEGVRINLNQMTAAFGLNLGSADLSQYTHLLVTVTNNQPTPTMVQVAFDSGAAGWAWTNFVIGGNKTEDVQIPLQASSFGGWGGGAPIVDPNAHQAAFYGSLIKNDVRRLRFISPMRVGTQDLTIGQVTPVSLPTLSTSIIDAYGQLNTNFAGRITSDSQLASQAAVDAQLSGQLPYSNDAYGGVAGSGLDAGTGHWRVAKQNGRWYLIDPSGNRFFSTGIDCVGNGSLAFSVGRDSMFVPGALPAPGSTLGQFYYNVLNPHTGNVERGYDFYQANLERKYGSNWATSSTTNIVKRLRTWGFNTVGVSSSYRLYDPTLHMANMQETKIAGAFRTIDCPGQSFTMGDPYDPAWAAAVNSTLSPLVAKLKLDPYNVGLFVDNELPWAWHWSSANYRYDLAFNVLSAPANQPAKVRFYNDMLLKYRTIARLNTAWRTSYASWSAMLNNRSFRPANPTPTLALDMRAFLTKFANQYFSTIRSKLTSLGYPGLYMGCRFAFYCPEAVAAAARYCNVVSFNAYDLTPSQWRSDLKTLNAPVLISEFGFAASDQGRVGGFSPSAPTEGDRVDAYQGYIADAQTWPNLVGLHWYKWEDDPVSGRMFDDCNETIGLVSITDIPYGQMIAAATEANTYLNSRMTTP